MKRFIYTYCLLISLMGVGQDLEINYLSGEKYAIVIGISKYKISSNNLMFAQKDAQDFSKALANYGEFKSENVKLLVNNDASRENIRKNIEGWLKSKAKKNDMVVIFFSGHGSQIDDTDNDEDDGLDECLVPYDFDSYDSSSLISDDIFAYWIRNLQSENILIIFDSCFSGGAAKEKTVHLAGVKGNVGNDDFMKDISRELPKKGTALLAASKADQISFESVEFKNGVFTHFLLDAISTSSDNDLNKIVSARELFYATKQKTLEYSKNILKKEQEPIFLDLLTKDLDIFRLPTEKRIKNKVNNIEIENLEYQTDHEQDPKKRLDMYKKLQKLKPDNAKYSYEIASINEMLGNNYDAIESYKQVLSLKDDTYSFTPPITVLISRVYEKMGNLNSAIIYLVQAIKKDSNSPFLYNEISNLYFSQKDTLNALQSLNKSLSIQPLQNDPYIKCFFLHLNKGDMKTANRLIATSYTINTNDFATQYCYYLSQKYISHIAIKDSVFSSIAINSGIRKRILTLQNVDQNITYIYNNRILSKEESRIQSYKDAIDNYPYYPEFYKLLIQYITDNKIDKDIEVYKNRYLYYSKLNPDIDFIKKYIRY